MAENQASFDKPFTSKEREPVGQVSTHRPQRVQSGPIGVGQWLQGPGVRALAVRAPDPGARGAGPDPDGDAQRLGGVVERPERLAGLHFFNPAPLMALVEVVSGLATDAAVA